MIAIGILISIVIVSLCLAVCYLKFMNWVVKKHPECIGEGLRRRVSVLFRKPRNHSRDYADNKIMHINVTRKRENCLYNISHCVVIRRLVQSLIQYVRILKNRCQENKEADNKDSDGDIKYLLSHNNTTRRKAIEVLKWILGIGGGSYLGIKFIIWFSNYIDVTNLTLLDRVRLFILGICFAILGCYAFSRVGASPLPQSNNTHHEQNSAYNKQKNSIPHRVISQIHKGKGEYGASDKQAKNAKQYPSYVFKKLASILHLSKKRGQPKESLTTIQPHQNKKVRQSSCLTSATILFE